MAQVSEYDPDLNEVFMLSIHEETEDKRATTEARNLMYKRRTARYHNSKVSKKNLVLRNAKCTGHNQNKGKLSSKWEGSYIVKEKVRPKVFRLMYENGQLMELKDLAHRHALQVPTVGTCPGSPYHRNKRCVEKKKKKMDRFWPFGSSKENSGNRSQVNRSDP